MIWGVFSLTPRRTLFQSVSELHKNISNTWRKVGKNTLTRSFGWFFFVSICTFLNVCSELITFSAFEWIHPMTKIINSAQEPILFLQLRINQTQYFIPLLTKKTFIYGYSVSVKTNTMQTCKFCHSSIPSIFNSMLKNVRRKVFFYISLYTVFLIFAVVFFRLDQKKLCKKYRCCYRSNVFIHISRRFIYVWAYIGAETLLLKSYISFVFFKFVLFQTTAIFWSLMCHVFDAKIYLNRKYFSYHWIKMVVWQVYFVVIDGSYGMSEKKYTFIVRCLYFVRTMESISGQCNEIQTNG